MTDNMSGPSSPAGDRFPPGGVGPVIWLVRGVLTVTDRDLPAALHKLADHADLCVAGFPSENIGGIIMHGRLKLTWSIAVPREEILADLVDNPDPDARYRLLTLIVTTFAS